LHDGLHGLLAWLEGSALGIAIRGAGVWAYGLLNLAHILGVATLFGAILILDLRLIGAWRSVPLAAIARPAVPVAAAGFLLAAAAGMCMITTNATQYAGNAFLLVKFPAIALALANVVVLVRLPAWRARHEQEPQGRGRTQLAVAGAFSLLCWLAAVAAGRMIAYW
jgi:hypothetical protein